MVSDGQYHCKPVTTIKNDLFSIHRLSSGPSKNMGTFIGTKRRNIWEYTGICQENIE